MQRCSSTTHTRRVPLVVSRMDCPFTSGRTFHRLPRSSPPPFPLLPHTPPPPSMCFNSSSPSPPPFPSSQAVGSDRSVEDCVISIVRKESPSRDIHRRRLALIASQELLVLSAARQAMQARCASRAAAAKL